MPVPKIVNVASVPNRSPFRYPGGKTWLIPHIRKWMRSLRHRPHLFVEPFVGGGIVALTVAFEGFADHVVMVELDPDVAAVWKVITSPDFAELGDRIGRFQVSEKNVRDELAKDSQEFQDIAFRTILKNRMFHGGILAPGASLIKSGENGKGLMSRWYPKTLSDRIRAIGEIRDRITFVEGDGIEAIEKHPLGNDVIFFIDPPYTVAGKKAGSRLYKYNELDHARLFEVVNSNCSDFLMTYDNADGVRELASVYGFDLELVAMKNTHHAKMAELLIGRDLGWSRSSDQIAQQRELNFD